MVLGLIGTPERLLPWFPHSWTGIGDATGSGEMLLGLQPQNMGSAFSLHTQAILLTLSQQGFWVCWFLETPPWPGPHRLTSSSLRPAGLSISPEASLFLSLQCPSSILDSLCSWLCLCLNFDTRFPSVLTSCPPLINLHVLCAYAQSCLTVGDPMDCSPPGSSVHGTFQARILELVAISYPRGIFLIQGLNPSILHLLHWQVDSMPLSHLGSP